jgi:hypothetical protein
LSGDLTFTNNVVDCGSNAFVTSQGEDLSAYFNANGNSTSSDHGLTWSPSAVSLAGRADWASWTLAMTSGWVSPGEAVQGDVVVSSNVTGTAYWTANNTYHLDGSVFVEPGATLYIEAGTVVKGMPGQGVESSYLCVAKGAQIFAEGTADAPIIFTFEADPLDGSTPLTTRGQWGGLIVLGEAGLNSTPGVSSIEGIPTNVPFGQYGGDNDADNSGVITYVSIRHGGTEIGAGNEINGFTLGGVGSGTTINNVEVIANADDGIEFFGGTVSIQNAMVAGVGDDSYDYDEGWRGQLNSNWVAVASSDDGDRGGEHDGGTDPETAQPYATPTITYATFVGRGVDAGKRALTFRDNAGGNYSNSVFFNYARGVDVEDLSEGEDSYSRLLSGDLTFTNNVVDCGSNTFVTSQGEDLSEYFNANGNSTSSDHGLSYGSTVQVCSNSDKGAFNALTGNWASWTLAMSSGFLSYELPSGCIDPSANNFNPFASTDDGSCEYNCTPDWDVVVTDQNHSIFINGQWFDVDGNQMSEGSLIGVFYDNGSDELACAGYTEIGTGTVQIAAMGDDSQTSLVDGLVAGQELVYHVWDASSCEVYSGTVEYTNGPEVYTGNGITFINNIYASPFGPTEQLMVLPSGWSMFSCYMLPDNLALDNLLSEVINDVIIAKNYLGAAYLPEFNFNGVGDIQVGQGYQVKMDNSNQFTVTGEYLDPSENPILLPEGWFMVGYLREEPAPADLVFADIVSDVIIAKDYLGAAYLPEFNFNGIGDMEPGIGYQVKTAQAVTLQYLSNDDSYRMSATEVTENNVSHYSKVAATDNNMIVVIEDAAWDVLPTGGSEIAAFDKEGNMVGSAIYSSPVTVLTVWGDDATTVSKDGMLVSESVSFKVWNTNEVSDFTVSKWIEGSSSYQVDGISVASTIETNNVMTELNASERVLVKVINVLGQDITSNYKTSKGVLFHIYDDGTSEKIIK